MKIFSRSTPLAHTTFYFLVFLALFLLAGSAQASKALLSEQQRDFIAAEKALKKGDVQNYQALKSRLQDYVLYPYLEYAEARGALGNAKVVERFESEYADTPMAGRLATQRLKYLGDKGLWREYLKRYKGSSSPKLKCYKLRAQASVKGKNEEWYEDVRAIWMTGKTLPPACNPLFNTLYDSGKVNSHQILQRARMAIEANNLSLAKFLAKKLGTSDKQWYRWWLEMHKKPLETLKKSLKVPDSAVMEEIVLHGVARYSRKDTLGAWAFWTNTLRTSFDFSREQIDKVEGKLILRAAWRHLPEVNGWYKEVNESALNEEAKQWRVRSAIRAGDWKAALNGLDKLPEGEKSDTQWKYWRARALEQLGKTEEATTLFEELAETTGYYGFLAADRQGKSYRFTSIPIVTKGNDGKVDTLATRPGMLRARELFDLGRNVDAMREWQFQLKSMSRQEKKLAARLAQRWGWHFAAILTASKAGHLQDLELRFPLVYRNDVIKFAKRHGVNPSWVYGVVRRESAFREAAVSPVGALGLMQLMPGTARNVAKRLGLPRHSKKELKVAAKNINLGASYLREVLDTYGGNEVLATASYNAGPHRVKKWLPEDRPLEADVWIDSITFDETRAYVKAVLFYSTLFDRKMNGKARGLASRMKPVKPLKEIEPTRRGA